MPVLTKNSGIKRKREQFTDAVTPALESLIDDLHKTTEVLRQKGNAPSVGGYNTGNNGPTRPIGGWGYEQQQQQQKQYQLGRSDNNGRLPAALYREQPQRVVVAEQFDNVPSSSILAQQTNGQASKTVLVSPLHSYGQQSQAPTAERPLATETMMMDQPQYNHHQHHQQQQQYPRPASSSTSDGLLMATAMDADKHGIHTIPKGDCAACEKPIIGQVVIALGRMWHPDHFSCSHCGAEIGHRNFFERAGRAYCESDYHDLFSPRCSYCNGPVKERYVNALNQTFHPEHFLCSQCGRPLEGSFFERDGAVFCKDDFYRIYAPKCHGCKQPITARFVTAMDTHWHSDCFCCKICSRPFGYDPHYIHRGSGPLCEHCFHTSNGSLCEPCQRPISGRCIVALGKRYHPEHLRCSLCHRQIANRELKEVNERPFCRPCYERGVPI